MIPENRNAKGEDHGKFAAEMLALAKRPEMRGFLTSTEVARQAKEKAQQEEADKLRKEAEAAELKRRDEIAAEWFAMKMMGHVPDLWMEFQATQNRKVLSLAKWRMTAKAGSGAPDGYTPVPITVCSIFHKGKLQIRERLVWEEPKPIPSKLILPGAPMKDYSKDAFTARCKHTAHIPASLGGTIICGACAKGNS